MPTELYLDTARLGRMCPAARKAEQDFAKLVSQSGSSLYCEKFLSCGFEFLPRQLKADVPHLQSWSGISGLKSRLREFVGISEPAPVLLASRSANLMTLAAHCLFRRCHNVMTTDAVWPPYLTILQRVATQTKRELTVVPYRQVLLQQRVTVPACVERLAEFYELNHCDGLFISDITFFGMRLPFQKLVDELRSRCSPPRFSVVDGAQALNHAPLQLTSTHCDIYLTGTHKWLRAYLPLSIACCCNRSSYEFIDDTMSKCRHDGTLDDPLFDFCLAAEREDFQPFGETVNVTPLITAAAALARTKQVQMFDQWSERQHNRQLLIDILSRRPWVPVQPCDTMRTAAVLFQARSRTRRTVSSRQLRSQFHSKGICLSAYDEGYVRVSVPSRPFSSAESRVIRRAFSE